jgi:hypothetical protein
MRYKLLLLLAVIPSICTGSVYYVRTDGNDANTGLANNSGGAWLTVGYAASNVTAGDTVLVQSGTFLERVSVTASGGVGSPIVFTGSTSTAGGFVITGSNIVVSSFALNGTNVPSDECAIQVNAPGRSNYFNAITISGFTNGITSGFGGVWASLGTSNLLFSGITITNPNATAVTLFGKHHTFQNSLITGETGWDAFRILGSSITIAGNVVTNYTNVGDRNPNHSDVFQSFGDNNDVATNVVIEGNFVYNCEGYQLGNITDDQEVGEIGYWQIRNNVFAKIGQTLNLYAPGFQFFNNTFYQVGTNSGWAIIYGDAAIGHSDDLQIENNIFQECGYAGLANRGWYTGDAISGLIADYNLVVGTGDGTVKTGFTETHGINGEDPLLVNFVPQAGSPAIGSGTDLSAFFTDDFTSSTRVAPWDIGAYEYLGRRATAGTVNVGTLTITP